MVRLRTLLVIHAADGQCRQERNMTGQNAELAIHAGSADIIHIGLQDDLVRSDYFKAKPFHGCLLEQY